MDWIIFAILSPVVYSIVVFIDKYILEREIKDYRGMPIYAAIMGIIFGTLFWIGSGFPTLPLQDILLILLSGALTVWAAAFYFKALSTEEASEVMILLQLLPIFVLLLSLIFLQEIISLQQFLGFMLILLGTFGVSIKKKDLSMRLSSAFFFMIFADILWAGANILFKFVTETSSFSEVVSYESWGLGVGGLLLLCSPSVRQAFFTTIHTLRKRALAVIFINEGVYVLSKLCAFLAISIGPVTLVSVIGSTSVFFGIVYGWLLTLLAPKIFRENITKEGLIKKLILAVIIFIGIVLIS